MQFRVLIFITLLLLCPLVAAAQDSPFLRISVEDQPDASHILISSSQQLSTSIETSSNYILVRIRSVRPLRVQRPPFQSRLVETIGWSRGSDYYLVNIKTKVSDFEYTTSHLSEPPRLLIRVVSPGDEGALAEPDDNNPALDITPGRAGTDSAARSPLPAQGMKTIVIDPGHGGILAGAEGKFGTLEKNVTLDISLKLKSIIERQGYRVVLTRDRDVDKSLEDRAAIANNNRAFVFISIHANGSQRKAARGSETFFLSMNATDEEARRLAYLENNSTELEKIESPNEDDIKMILWDMAQVDYLRKSSELAESIQAELNTLLGTRNRGVKQAPFKVLTGVACPAVLVEVAFISNPDEERKLGTAEFQQKVAQAIYDGLANFLRKNE